MKDTTRLRLFQKADSIAQRLRACFSLCLPRVPCFSAGCYDWWNCRLLLHWVSNSLSSYVQVCHSSCTCWCLWSSCWSCWSDGFLSGSGICFSPFPYLSWESQLASSDRLRSFHNQLSWSDSLRSSWMNDTIATRLLEDRHSAWSHKSFASNMTFRINAYCRFCVPGAYLLYQTPCLSPVGFLNWSEKSSDTSYRSPSAVTATREIGFRSTSHLFINVWETGMTRLMWLLRTWSENLDTLSRFHRTRAAVQASQVLEQLGIQRFRHSRDSIASSWIDGSQDDSVNCCCFAKTIDSRPCSIHVRARVRLCLRTTELCLSVDKLKDEKTTKHKQGTMSV